MYESKNIAQAKNGILLYIKKNIQQLALMFLLVASEYICCGKVRGTVFLTILGIGLYCEEIYKLNKGHYVECIVFVLTFFRIGINPYFSLFEMGTQYVYLAITAVLAVFVKKNGLYIEVKIRHNKYLIIKLILLMCIDYMFFGFQLKNVVSKKLAFLLALIFIYWIVTLIRLIIAIAKKIVCDAIIFTPSNNYYTRAKIIFAWFSTFLLLFIPGIIMSIIYYPGHITYDNAFNYFCATHLGTQGTVTDVHSMGYVLCTMALLHITKNYYIITFFLMTTFAIIWASFFTYLCKKGLRISVAVILTIVWISFPCNQLLLICSWKDNPFVNCMLLTAYMLTKLCMESEFDKKWGNLILLCIGLLGLAVFRSNGLVVYVVILAAVVIAFIHKKIKWRTFAAVLIVGMILGIFKGPVFYIFNVEKAPESFNSIPFVDGVWENIHNGNTLDGDAKKFVDDYLVVTDKYIDSTYSAPITFKKNNGEFTAARKAYVWCLINHPKTTITARLKRTYNIWGVFQIGAYDATSNYGNELENFREMFKLDVPFWTHPVKFESIRESFWNTYNDKSLLGSFQFLFKRCGFHLFLWMICAYELFKHKNKKYLLIILPAISNAIALFLGCAFTDYRYFYPMFVLSVPFYCVVLLVFNNQNKKLNETKKVRTKVMSKEVDMSSRTIGDNSKIEKYT